MSEISLKEELKALRAFAVNPRELSKPVVRPPGEEEARRLVGFVSRNLDRGAIVARNDNQQVAVVLAVVVKFLDMLRADTKQVLAEWRANGFVTSFRVWIGNREAIVLNLPALDHFT